jgi:RsiW-degrading membrane proteinase PrsW (M82 family)
LNNARPLHWPSVFQFVLSALAALGQFSIAAMLTLAGLLELIQGGFLGLETTQSFMMAASLLLTGMLVLPSAWYALRRLNRPNEPPPTPRKKGWLIPTLLLIFFLPPALLVGNLIARNDQVSWLLLPALNVLVVGLPIYWLVFISKRGLPGGSPQRQWGIFASGLILGPSIILVIEFLGLFMLGGIGMLAMIANPRLQQEVFFIVSRIPHAEPDPQVWLNILSPLLQKPLVIFSIFSFGAVIVPLVEEAFKPIGLWLLAGRRFTPAEGFVGGLLSGAGFALFENLGNASTGGETWALLVGTRITTALLHILTSGLTGWALSHALTRGRYFRLAFVYTLAVILHGIWNGLGIGSFWIDTFTPLSNQSINVDLVNSLVVIALGCLTAMNFILLLAFSRGLRKNLERTGISHGTTAEESNLSATVPPEPEMKLESDGMMSDPSDFTSPSEDIPPQEPTQKYKED